MICFYFTACLHMFSKFINLVRYHTFGLLQMKCYSTAVRKTLNEPECINKTSASSINLSMTEVPIRQKPIKKIGSPYQIETYHKYSF